MIVAIDKFTNLDQSGIILAELVETTCSPSVDHIKWKTSLNNPPTFSALPTKQTHPNLYDYNVVIIAQFGIQIVGITNQA